MVSPDGTGSGQSRSERGRWGLFAGAALVIAVGFAVLGALTSPVDQRLAVDTTTTSTSTTTTIGEILPPIDMDDFTVEQLETGPQLEWSRVELIDSAYPLGLTEHEGAVYLFATTTPEFQDQTGGLTAWRSSDGSNWDPLGQVIGDDYYVSMVTSTERGLVAAGTSVDGSSLAVWISPDGARWTETEFTDEDEHYSSRHYPMAIGANDDLVVVAASSDIDREMLLEEHLQEAGMELDLSQIGWSTEWRGEEGHWLTIDGPLGMSGLELDLDQLDLTEQEAQWITEGYGGTQETALWVIQRGTREWHLISIDGVNWVESLVSGPDGAFALIGWGPAGRVSRQSRDGLSWTDFDPDHAPMQIQSWKARLVGVDDTARRPEILVSDDGVSWEPVGLAERFPLPIHWSVAALGSGDDGLALSVIGYDTTATITDRTATEITTDEGYRLSLDLEPRIMELTTGANTHTWEIYRSETPEGVEVDVVERIVTLSDPHTGETLTQLSFEELMRAEHAYYMERFQSDEHKALVFTEDGSQWTIQSSAGLVGTDTWVHILEVAAGHVYATVLHLGDTYNPFAAPGFELWAAEIP